VKWIFIDKDIIREKESGYIIELIAGTWINPQEIKPITPKQAKFVRQAELLRRGLEFAYEYMLEKAQA